MATAIKAIPTLRGEDAICFREEMEAKEGACLHSSNHRDEAVTEIAVNPKSWMG